MGAGPTLGMCFGSVLVGLYRYLMVFTSFGLHASPDPGVVVPYPGLDRSIALQAPGLGHIWDIRMFPDAADDRRIGIAAEHGILLTDIGLTNRALRRMSKPRHQLQFYGVDDAGYAGLIGVDFWEGITVYDPDGRAAWDIAEDTGIWSVAAIDFKGDGVWHFIVGYEQRGIGLFDRRGSEVWRNRGGTVWTVAERRLRGDRPPMIVHSESPGELVMRDASGTETYRNAPSPPWSSFILSPWPNRDSEPHMIRVQSRRLRVDSSYANAVASYEIPIDGMHSGFSATPVQFRENAAPYFAVAVAVGERTELFLYNRARTLIYHEVLDEIVSAIAAIPEPGTDTESLLVGGEGKVWRYRWDETKSNQAETDSSS